jgi:hypothetical protein
MPSNSDAIEKASKQIEAELRTNITTATGVRDDEWLRFLYDNYHKRFLSDNERIWDNGKLMIPFSLAAFGIYANIVYPSWIQLIVLGVASSALSIIWLINAENHRAFQNKSIAWVMAIERLIGLDKIRVVKISDDELNKKLSGQAVVRRSIRWLSFGVPLVWMLLAFYKYFFT